MIKIHYEGEYIIQGEDTTEGYLAFFWETNFVLKTSTF